MVTVTSVFTSNGQVTTQTHESSSTSSSSATPTSDSNNNNNKSSSGLSQKNKVVVGCVVGIVTPVLIIGALVAWWFSRKNKQNVDHSGKEWNDDEVVDDGLDFDDDEAVDRSKSVNRAVNF